MDKRDYEKFMKQASTQVLKELSQEINNLSTGVRPLGEKSNAKNDLIHEYIREILSTSFTRINDIPGIKEVGRINLNDVFVRINPIKTSINGYKIDMKKEFLINVFSENKTEDNKIRLSFYGGDLKNEEGESIVISPISWITDDDSGRRVSSILQQVFTEKLSTKVTKIAQQMEINIKDNK